MRKITAIIVDDSAVYRTQIRKSLRKLPWVEINATAPNGRLALDLMGQSAPDLLILDLEMPEMNGVETLRELKSRSIKCKVLVFSSTSPKAAESAMEALRLGADDFVVKPGATKEEEQTPLGTDPSDKIGSLLIPRIEALFKQTTERLQAPAPASTSTNLSTAPYAKVIWSLFKPKIVVIGSSTGGPSIIEKIFSELKTELNCPILIAQHMPPVFTATFAERIQRISGIPASEVKHDEPLLKNHIYVAPGDYHFRVKGDAQNLKAHLDQGPQINSVRPAVDPLFESASNIFGRECLGIVLTGMGADGKVGADAIKRAGGAVVIQSQESCVVFGMPGAVHAIGAYDKAEDPAEIINILREKAGVSLATLAKRELKQG